VASPENVKRAAGQPVHVVMAFYLLVLALKRVVQKRL
jgi:hypothetical protein